MRKSVNFAVALLLGLLIASAPNGRDAFGQQRPNPFELTDPFEVLLWMFGVKRPAQEKRLADLHVGASLLDSFETAVQGLREGSEFKFNVGRDDLMNSSHSYSISARNRSLAKRMLAMLPEKFEEGYAFRRDDGTVAKDPDEFIRRRLVREQHSIFGGGEAGGED